MATISFVGTLGRDAELKNIGNNHTALLTLNVAESTYNSATKEKATIWYRCNVWGARAESNLKDYLLKGQQVFVSGELSVSEYQDKSGVTKTSLEVRINEIKLVGSIKKDNQATQSLQQQAAPQQSYDTHYNDDITF